MPRASIADIRANSEFQKTFEWYFSFIRWPKAVATSITQDRFNMQCLSTSKPHKSSKAEVFMMRGEQIFDIGIYKVTGMLPLVFLETVDGIIHEMFQDLGYYPFGSKYFSDLVHYVRSGDFVRELLL